MAETKDRRPAVERVKPPEAIIKVGNPIFGWLLRSRLHGLVDGHLMLMRFQGRKKPVEVGRVENRSIHEPAY